VREARSAEIPIPELAGTGIKVPSGQPLDTTLRVPGDEPRILLLGSQDSETAMMFLHCHEAGRQYKAAGNYLNL
jgi:hypothetical protein